MEELHILLTSSKEHQKVFPNMSVVGVQNGKSLEDYLVRSKLPKLKRVEDVKHVEEKLA